MGSTKEVLELPPEDTAQIKANMRSMFCQVLTCPESRLKDIEVMDPGMEGKIGVHCTWDPELTPEESETLKGFLGFLMKLLGASPPIYPAKA
jgi:hypothetical protein